MSDTAPDGPAAAPAGSPTAARAPRASGHTRASATWTAVVAATVLLIALIIFIAQNTQESTVNFLGAHGRTPTAVALLASAVGGAIIVVIVGTARILQLRRMARRSRAGGEPAPGGAAEQVRPRS